MKSIFLLIIFMCSTFLMFGQKGISIVVFGMPQRTFMHGPTNQDYKDIIAQNFPITEGRELTKKPSYNFSLGFFFRHILHRRLTIGYGFQQSSHEQKYRIYETVEDNYINYGIRLKYIRIPVFLDFYFIAKQKYKFFVSTGPAMDILISENGEQPVYGANSNRLPILEVTDPAGVYRNFVLGGILFIGSEVRMSEAYTLLVHTYLNTSFTQVQNRSYREGYFDEKIFDPPNVTLLCNRNITTGVLVGISYKIR